MRKFLWVIVWAPNKIYFIIIQVHCFTNYFIIIMIIDHHNNRHHHPSYHVRRLFVHWNRLIVDASFKAKIDDTKWANILCWYYDPISHISFISCLLLILCYAKLSSYGIQHRLFQKFVLQSKKNFEVYNSTWSCSKKTFPPIQITIICRKHQHHNN
jgi:hypothetical protein